MDTSQGIRKRWLEQLLSTEPAHRVAAEAGVKDVFTAAGRPAPQRFLWFDSPFQAAWVAALIYERRDPLLSGILATQLRAKSAQGDVAKAKAQLASMLGTDDTDTQMKLIGRPLNGHAGPDGLKAALITARFGLSSDAAHLFKVPDDSDDLNRAETCYIGSNLGVVPAGCSPIRSLLGDSMFFDYSFVQMATDEEEVGAGSPPALLAALWSVARSSGLWWAFEQAAVLSERPTALHTDGMFRVHREDGPAVSYLDGQVVYAWEGNPLPEKYIMAPETLSKSEIKHIYPSLSKHLTAKLGSYKSPAKPKPSAVLKLDLPTLHAERLAALREAAGGNLPYLDRYLAGEREAVWKELVALGSTVRLDPHAADALAVAYETMHRVECNVRTVLARLQKMGYRFTNKGKGHVPPPPDVKRHVKELEKAAGSLPFSLKAFYEVVGSVDWMGKHPSFSVPGESFCTDPLVVFSAEDALQAWESMEDEEGENICIAPDAFHKADISGGDAYEIEAKPAADATVVNEPHEVTFVEYLRLCFRFGGFPGFDESNAPLPQEIEHLRQQLLDF